VLVALFGHLWLVAEAIPKFRLGHEVVDFLSINGQSFRYSFSIIQLDEPDLVNVARDDLTLKAQKLQDLVIWCKKHKDKVRQSAALRLANHYGAAQIVSDGHALDIDAKLVCGRRTHFNAELNELRNKIYESTKAKVEIVSYDRVVDALDQMLRYRY